ncbi:hypothetical protein ACFV4P_24845 [Kitasatospora sp. NPDC059795]|uniref:hypothetical protein n=1 Tax=Kitasatospora sp. NPDC059795 TaxID=3346949 RepID=UPI003666B8E3
MRNPPTRHRARIGRAVAGTSALALSSVLMLSACSSGGSDKSHKVASLGDRKIPSSAPPEAAAGEQGDMVKYAGCMRERGVDMPDPGPDGSMQAGPALSVPAGSDGVELKKMEDAGNACRKWLPNGGVLTEKQKTEQREQQLKMAKCLREHGVDAPDPNPGDDQAGTAPVPSGADRGKFEEAFRACAPAGGNTSATVGG